MKKITALITGGSGYFGSLLTKKLLLDNYNCIVYDLIDSTDRPNNVDFIKGDIRDLNSITSSLKGIDVVFHNVAQVPLAKNINLFKTVNVDGTRNILEASKINNVKKVVYTSSSAIFGVPDKLPVTENSICHPCEPYGEAKLEGEVLCREYSKKGLDVSIIRPRTIIGHGRLGIFQILFEWVRNGHNIPVLGNGDNLYQFVHADDLASACILSSKVEGFSIFNCGAEKFGTMRDTLEALCSHANTGSKVVGINESLAVSAMNLSSKVGLSPLGPYHSLMYGKSMYFDISLAKKELNWHPKYSNISMLNESYDWYCKNIEVVRADISSSHHRSPVKQGILSLLKFVL